MTGRAGTMATPARSGRALAAVAGQLERGVRHHLLCPCVVMNYAIVLLRFEQKRQIKKDAK